MSNPPTLSTLALPPDLDADDVLGLFDQLSARVAAALLPAKGKKKQAGGAVLPAGLEPMEKLPPHIALSWKRFEDAAAKLRQFRHDRASAQAEQAHAASDETEQEAANTDADDRWRAFEQWSRGAAGLAEDGSAPSPAEARWLVVQLFAPPEGLRFITRRPRVQWNAMKQRMEVLEGARAQAVIAGFGGARHHAQLVAAHTRFGKAFGFTTVVKDSEEGPTDGRPQWVSAREALRSLVLKIENHADPEIEASEALAEYLLGPYVEMVVDLEKSRRSRAKKGESASTAPAGQAETP